MKRSKVRPSAMAFTLIELLVVISIIVLLLSIMTPTLFRAKELARRAQCRGNLGVLGRGMSSYSADYVQEFACESPCVGGYTNIGGATQQQGGNPATVNPAVGGTIGGSAGVSRALYLLVFNKYASTTAFVCPSADGHQADTLPPSGQTWFDFTDYKKLSYSYMVRKNPISTTPPTAKYPLWIGSNPGLVYLADRNPISGIDGWTGTSCTPDGGANKRSGYDEYGGTPTVPLPGGGNSFNHQQEGQLVVSVDASIRWTTTPYCGVIDTGQDPNVADNIWTPTFGSTSMPNFGADTVPDDSNRNNEGNDSLLWP